MTDQITELEAQLKKKEKLVAALTERLEQAAEQLDRVHRTGADRGVRSGGGGGSIPPELVEEQRALTQELQQAVSQWDESQPTEALRRIENHLLELREQFSTLSSAGLVSPGSPPPSPMLGSSGEDTGATENPDPGQNSSLTGYEALKASMLSAEGGLDSGSPEHPVEQTPGSVSPEVQEGISGSQPETEDEQEPDPVDPPEPIDLDTADQDALRHAVESRDSYIGYLIKKLRLAESRGVMSVDWASLENVPDELRSRLQELEARMEESLRLAEVELALERARLGREENRLEQLETRIRRQMKKLGLAEDGSVEKSETQDNSNGDNPAGEGEDDSGNRWLRMLGR